MGHFFKQIQQLSAHSFCERIVTNLASIPAQVSCCGGQMLERAHLSCQNARVGAHTRTSTASPLAGMGRAVCTRIPRRFAEHCFWAFSSLYDQKQGRKPPSKHGCPHCHCHRTSHGAGCTLIATSRTDLDVNRKWYQFSFGNLKCRFIISNVQLKNLI